MRSLRRGDVWTAGRQWLWAGSFGLAISGTAFGQSPNGAGAESAALHEEFNKIIGVSATCYPDGCAVPSDVCGDLCADASFDNCVGDGCAGEGHCGGALGDPWTLTGALHGDDPCNPPFLTIGGWTQFGYHNESTGMFNSHPDQLVSHQNYLYLERVADGSNGLGFGFRGDVVYGADAQDTQAFGEPTPQSHWDTDWDHGIYGWALPQLYAEAAYGDWTIKAGKFYTPIGYEVVTAPDNFFYSHSFTMYNSEPFTHTGALATFKAADNTTLYGGWVAGWDTGFDRFSDGDDSRGSAAIYGVSQGIGDALTLTYIALVGDMGLNGEGYNHSIVADFALTDKLNYVFQSDYVHLNFESIGINNFLFYTINDKLKVGGRAEWWKQNALTGGGWESAYQVTAGVNYKPIANLVIRPEYRYQWGSDSITNLGGANGQPAVVDDGIFGIDAILTF